LFHSMGHLPLIDAVGRVAGRASGL